MYTKEIKMMFANLEDKYNISNKKNVMTVSNFIDKSQLEMVKAFLKGKGYVYDIYTMHEECDRVVIVFGYNDGSVVTCFRLVNNGYLHKDILGSLFSLGLSSDVIGDIFIEEDYCYFIVSSRVREVIKNTLVMIRNDYIELEEVFKLDGVSKKYEVINITISSFRIDLLLSKLLKKSRSQIQDVLSDNRVLCNYKVIKEGSYIVKCNDVLSIRGFGKYTISDNININSKGLTNIQVLKSC